MPWRTTRTLAHAFLPHYPLSVGGNNSRTAFYSHTLIYHPMFLAIWKIWLLQAGDWQTFS